MKVALAHDWLSSRLGGAERVLEELAKMYPEAPIYTLLYDEHVAGSVFPRHRIVSSSLQRTLRPLRNRPRYLLPLIPAAVEGLDFRGYDLVISSSGAWMKNILTSPQTRHLSYCHSPMRFVWDYWPAYLDEQRLGPLRSMIVRQITSYLRIWDRQGEQRVDRFLANSKTTAARIRKYYGRDSSVVYPPVAIDEFQLSNDRGAYLVTLGALTPYKKWDLVIESCRRLGQRLLVVGDGPDRERLMGLAGPETEFRGYVTRDELASLLARARALVFPQEEDFGIAAVEALASGTPVIAYRSGGAAEIITPETGIFFEEQTLPALEKAIRALDHTAFDLRNLRKRAGEFGPDIFRERIRAEVEGLMR